MPEATRRFWALVSENSDEPLLQSDRERCQAVLQARQEGSGWPEAVAGQMDRHYSPGRTWEATALGFLGLMHLGDVLDAGSGDGTIAALLAARSRSVTCLDHSPKVLQAARRRLFELANVDFSLGDIHALPFAKNRFDQVLLLHVLTYAQDPVLALREAARVLRPGGVLVVSTLAYHEQSDVTAAYGHINNGFRAQDLRKWLAGDANLTIERCEITSREKRPPHFAVIHAFARKPDSLPLSAKEPI
jgi:ArsR family transcriptional regulator